MEEPCNAMEHSAIMGSIVNINSGKDKWWYETYGRKTRRLYIRSLEFLAGRLV